MSKFEVGESHGKEDRKSNGNWAQIVGRTDCVQSLIGYL